jgi:hypothetical protein
MERMMSRLIILLALYFCIYGSAHLYVLIKLRRAFYLHGISYGFLFVLLAFLMLAPIQARIIEAQGHLIWAIATAWTGYVWMGFLFIAICLSLPLDGYHLLIGLGQRLTHRDWAHLMLSRRQCVAFVILATLGLMAYGAFEAFDVRTETITLTTSKFPAKAKPVRMVQISDCHLGLMNFPGRLKPVLSAIGELKPDLLVCTGDLVDGHMLSADAIAHNLKALEAPLGKFAVTGNHESYMGLAAATRFIGNAGFQLLPNQAVPIGQYLTIAGVDDPAADSGSGPSEAQILTGVPNQRFTVLLKHRPVLDPESIGRFDLQLSGHTHKGQIFPFHLLIDLFYPLKHGLHTLEASTPGYLYVSGGTGTWGPPIRLLAPPEITVFNLIPDRKRK